MSELDEFQRHVNDFPDELLDLIFDYLSNFERRLCRLVCRRWMNTMRWSTIKFIGRFYVSENALMRFKESFNFYSKLVFEKIAYFDGSKCGWELLGEVAKSVTKLEINGPFNASNEDFEKLLQTIKPVALTIRSIEPPQLQSSSSFPSIKTLICDNLTLSDISKFSQLFPNLEKLHCNDLECLKTSNEITDLTNICSTIPRVFIEYRLISFYDKELKFLKSLSKVGNLSFKKLFLQQENITAANDVLQDFFERKGSTIENLIIAPHEHYEKYDLIYKHCKNVKNLSISFRLCDFCNFNYFSYENLPKIESLTAQCDGACELPHRLVKLKNLRKFDFTFWRTENPVDVMPIIETNKNLRELKLDLNRGYCGKLTYLPWSQLYLTQITFKNINIFDLSNSTEFFNQSYLESLTLENCNATNTKNMLKMFNFPRLTSLKIISASPYVNPEALISLSKSSPVIASIVFNNGDLDFDCIKVLVDHFCWLEFLDICNNNNVTAKSYAILRKSKIRVIVHDDFERNFNGIWSIHSSSFN